MQMIRRRAGWSDGQISWDAAENPCAFSGAGRNGGEACTLPPLWGLPCLSFFRTLKDKLFIGSCQRPTLSSPLLRS